jgi:hypothetical protein
MVYTSLLFRHIDRICYFSPADVLVISSQTVSGGGYELCSGKYSNDGLIIPRFRFPALYFRSNIAVDSYLRILLQTDGPLSILLLWIPVLQVSPDTAETAIPGK